MNPIAEKLLADGWKTFRDPFQENRTCYAKSFEGHAKCKCNAPKNKQVEVYNYHEEQFAGHTFPSRWHIHLNGELPDNEWVRIVVEGLYDYDTIVRKVEELLKAWDFLVSITPTIEEPQE